MNFTLRYVPDRHVKPFAKLARQARDDVRAYVRELAKHSAFFREQIAAEQRTS